MKSTLVSIGLLLVTRLAGASCPDVSGNFEGWCQEPGGRMALYRIQLEQTGCESVMTKVPFFRDEILISDDFGGRKYYQDGAFAEAKASYTESKLITQIRSVSARGEEILETTEFQKTSVNGIDQLDFTQSLSGAVSFSVSCRIPAK